MGGLLDLALMIPVLVITGPVGVGKSTVSQALSDVLSDLGIAHGVVELDAIRHCHPSPPGDRFHMAMGFRNLAAVAANYRAAGAKRLVLVDIVETRDQTRDYRRAIPGAEVRVVGLRGSIDTIQVRLESREAGADLAWHRRRAAELIEQWRAQPVEDLTVDTDGRTPLDIAREILLKCGWV
jgi:chloramphenicol 3-O-phosphotransferase